MRTTIVLTALGLAMALPTFAQEPPHHENHWDISKIDVTQLPAASVQKDVTFDKDILPLMKASCVHCHGEKKPHGNLRLDTRDGVLKGGHDGKMVVVGDSAKSLLVMAAAQIDPHTAMPPKHHAHPGGNGGGQNPEKPHPPAKPLTSDQVGLLRAWIDQGAN